MNVPTTHSVPSSALAPGSVAIQWNESELWFLPSLSQVIFSLDEVPEVAAWPSYRNVHTQAKEDVSIGAGIRTLLQNDSVKSGSESRPKAALVQLLVYKSHSCSELTEHKLSLVQRLFRDKALTPPAPVTPPSSSWEEEAKSHSNFSSAQEYPTKGIRGSLQGGKSALVNWKFSWWLNLE